MPEKGKKNKKEASELITRLSDVAIVDSYRHGLTLDSIAAMMSKKRNGKVFNAARAIVEAAVLNARPK